MIMKDASIYHTSSLLVKSHKNKLLKLKEECIGLHIWKPAWFWVLNSVTQKIFFKDLFKTNGRKGTDWSSHCVLLSKSGFEALSTFMMFHELWLQTRKTQRALWEKAMAISICLNYFFTLFSKTLWIFSFIWILLFFFPYSLPYPMSPNTKGICD